MTADEIKSLLKLEPHPCEGGFFRQTYVAAERVELSRSTRSVGTAIYYLLEPGTFSEMHCLASDEIFHFYLGDPVEMLQLYPDGRSALFYSWTGFEGRSAGATRRSRWGVARRAAAGDASLRCSAAR